MELSLNFEPVYQQHDLWMEIGRVELAMEQLDRRTEQERVVLRPRLESRRHRLLEQLQQLSA
ncbi:MAG: hypothetical protein KGN77_09440 [Xanthomonadaceae bacterium]|jgi:hypothetical protein|uniref:DUF465 domain-containing protein n=1 Tax=Dyella lutea TaxID=2950441 RepID=A0ABT1F6C4_9GAMM|nr:hypothetical protein [Dyella lutea]MBU6247967.1 hypothetical protein [Xanthomonadaceae bacterium]OZB61851.1 MAG: hypothetical protein B7X33_05900 [Xanthomonadales bacterium 13-68-4]OZB61910.1 MAG: hypothetical protein B7X45_00055 [Xanthomonadales bacterium 15-68-25]OZB67851.1 MAG: hypothetical protein B7X39_04745 [Xanthomonadales bacterium 14-68-21]HEU4669294.1 hypothetical protein [Dyella sp.]